MSKSELSLKFVIEHLEEEIGRWLYIEYRHASEIVGKENLLFTNVRRVEDRVLLSEFGKVEARSFRDVFRQEDVVILDPRAERKLVFSDFYGKKAVVVGGILGDNPPRGRTQRYLSNLCPRAIKRNLGRKQFSIDGAVYVAKMVSEGVSLENIGVVDGLSIRVDEFVEVYLPYAYPLRNGRPVIHEELVRYLGSDDVVRDEEELLRGKKSRKVAFWSETFKF